MTRWPIVQLDGGHTIFPICHSMPLPHYPSLAGQSVLTLAGGKLCCYPKVGQESWHLGGEGLDRLEVEVVVQVEIVEVLAVDQQIEHVVALAANLQPHLHPVQLG